MNRPALPRAARRVAALLAALVTLLGLASAPAWAAVDSISGTVTAAAGGAPLEGACVEVWQAEPLTFLRSSCTAADGRYEVAGLDVAGSYLLQVEPPTGYTGQIHDHARDLGTATPVPAGSVVDFALEQRGRLAGQLRFADRTTPPAFTVDLSIWDVDADLPFPRFVVRAGQAGRWDVQVPAGHYQVSLDTAAGTQWVPQSTDRLGATTFTVVPGGTTVVDETIPGSGGDAPLGSLSGRVVDATGTGVAGLCVTFAFPAEPPRGPEVCDFFGNGTRTSATGDYTLLDVPAGRWTVHAADPSHVHGTTVSAPVDLAEGQDLTGVDLAVDLAGTLTGRVLDRSTGRPLAGVCVVAFPGRDLSQGGVGGAVDGCTGTDGRYALGGLPQIPMTVQVPGDDLHVTLYAPNATTVAAAALVTPPAGGTLDLGTTRLPRGGTLTGRITGPDGKPLAGAWVVLGRFVPRAGDGSMPYTAQTDAAGRYVIRNIPQQTEPAVVYAREGGLAWQWSGKATDPATAKKLVIRYGRTTTFDARLRAPQALLTGTVTWPAEVGGVVMDAFTESGAEVGFVSDPVAPDQPFTVFGLPGSRVKLRFTIFDQDGTQRTLWYDGKTSLATATPIRVVSGRTTTLPTVTLPAAG